MRGDVHRVRARATSAGTNNRARYAVVVQSDDLLLSTLLVAPTSTSARAATSRSEVEIERRPTRVLVEQAAAVDPTRLGDLVGHLGFDELGRVEAALRLVRNR